MRILYAVQDSPLSPNAYGGAPALYYGHLELLAHSGHEITLVVIGDPTAPRGFDEFVESQPGIWQRISGWTSAFQRLAISPPGEPSGRVRRALRAVLDPTGYTNSIVNAEAIGSFRRAVAQERPDLIWAEDRAPAMLAAWSIPDLPIIYSQNDWGWRISLLRRGDGNLDLHARLRAFQMRRAEQTLVRRVAGCVSASAREVRDMEALGVRKVAYFPTTYPNVDLPADADHYAGPRVVHLGGMRATANRIGLERFLDVVWPEVLSSLREPARHSCPSEKDGNPFPELWIVGDLTGAPDRLLAKLKSTGARCTGFVQDLSTVLRPYDPHVIPWEHDTGTRTRLPVAFGYGQVLIGTRACVAGYPEAIDGVNCRLVAGLDDMAEAVLAMCCDAQRRVSLGRAARQTFRQSFTREALQARFDEFIAGIG